MDHNRRGNTSPLTPRVRSERIGSRSSMRARGSRVPISGGWKRFFNRKWILLSLLTAFLLTIGTVVTIMVSAETYKLNEIEHLKYSSLVVTEDGKEVGRIGSEYREPVTLKELEKYNKNLPLAFVKVEDERFYHHIGVDFWGLGRAVVKNIITGGKSEGASTITMQVAGNVVLKDRKKTYTRKIKEIGAALGLEMEYSKNDILQTYLNFVHLGNDAMGVKTAAKIYFGKDVTKQSLQPHEIALLAGLPKAPNGYNPYGSEKNRQKALERRNVVLAKMAEDQEYNPPLITQEEKEKYQKMGLGVDKRYLEKYGPKRKFAAYFDAVKEEVAERYPITKSDLDTGGYKIYVGIDPELQQIVENVLKDENNNIFVNDNGTPLKLVDAAVTIVDPKTGRIRAIGGGRDYKPGFNNWAMWKMQPGSSIKPLSVYTPAVEEHGYHENKTVNDTPPNIEGWDPKNYDGKIHGKVPMVEMVKNSYNLSTINLLKDVVGLDTAYKYATEKFKLPLDKNDRHAYAALALGGLTKGVSTIDMAQAYTAFPNYGKIVKAHTVIKVLDNEGNEIEPLEGKAIDDKGDPEKIIEPKTAWYMTRMLQRVVTDGTGKNAQLSDGRDVAGKTGTTQKYQNGWFVGYTTDLVGAVAVFNVQDQNGEQGKTKITGGSFPAKVFREIFEEYYQDKPVTHFQNPGIPDPPEEFDPNKFNFDAAYNPDKQAVELKWSYLGGNALYTLEYSEDGFNWTPLLTNANTDHFEHQVPQPDPNLLDQIFGGGKTIKYRLTVIPDRNVPDDTHRYEKEVTIPVKTDENNKKDKEKNNENNNGNGEQVPPDQQNDWLNEYCKQHPDDQLRCPSPDQGGNGGSEDQTQQEPIFPQPKPKNRQ